MQVDDMSELLVRFLLALLAHSYPGFRCCVSGDDVVGLGLDPDPGLVVHKFAGSYCSCCDLVFGCGCSVYFGLV